MQEEPFVVKKARTKSYLGEECERMIKEFLVKLGNPEKEMATIMQHKNAELSTQIREKDGTLYQYQMTAEQMEAELDNLLSINDGYQESIQGLEKVIETKDSVIMEHLKTISKLTEGNSQELQDLKLTFFSQ